MADSTEMLVGMLADLTETLMIDFGDGACYD